MESASRKYSVTEGYHIHWFESPSAASCEFVYWIKLQNHLFNWNHKNALGAE